LFDEGQNETPVSGDSIPSEVVAQHRPATYQTFQELMAEAQAEALA
jgi:hypothetical protein